MSSIEIAGIVVVGLGAVFTLFSVFLNLIVNPVNKLTISVTELVAALEGMRTSHGKLENRVNTHGRRLDKVEIQLARNSIK